MKPLLTLLVAGALLAPSLPAFAASACTAFVRVDEEDNAACMTFVRNRARDGGFTGSRTGETMFFWFDQNVVTARCIDGKLVAMAAYHRQNDRACPLLDRIKDTLGNR